MKWFSFILLTGIAFAQLPTITPKNPSIPSGTAQQFKASVPVTWQACGGSIDANGLFSAPMVAKKTNYCIIGTSIADPKQSGLADIRVDPPVVTCLSSIWSRIPVTAYYRLPTWVSMLSWIQPADVMYEVKEGLVYFTATPPLYFAPLYSPNPFCQYVLVDGGTPPYTYSATGLPTGLTITADGLIFGLPLPGVYNNVVLSATDAAGTTVVTQPRIWQVCVIGAYCDGFGGSAPITTQGIQGIIVFPNER